MKKNKLYIYKLYLPKYLRFSIIFYISRKWYEKRRYFGCTSTKLHTHKGKRNWKI